MRMTWRRGVPAVIGFAAILAVLGARGFYPEPFERMRLGVFDLLQRSAPWTPVVAQVRVVDIDEPSLKRFGQWPWPRSVIAALVGRLQDFGAGAIAFDFVFPEPDRTSPALLVKTWAKTYHWQDAAGSDAALPDYDLQLGAAFAHGHVVTGYGLLAEPNGAAPAPRSSIATIGGDPAATVRNFRGAVPNLELLETAAAGNGSFSITGGRDQIIRALPLLSAFDGRLVPSLALEALRVAQDEDTIRVRTERSGGAQGPVTGYTARVGDYDVPLDVDGALELHHGPAQGPGGGALGPVSAWRLLDPNEAATLEPILKGHIALIGTSAVGLSDLRATPLNPLEPGVNLHARALEQILAQHFLNRPLWVGGAEFCAAGLLAGLLVLLITLAGLRSVILAALGAGVVLIGGTFMLFATEGLLLDPSLVVLTIGSGGIVASFARYFVAERDAARLRSAFTHYLSPHLVEALARDPDRLKLGGELRDMTFLFTDLEGFTGLMEAIDPKTIVNLLNDYLDGLCRIATEHGGTVDKIVGDALHVMFNAPLDQPDHAARAVRCALAIDAFAQVYAGEQRARGIAFGVTRIGVNTGPAVVGNFGGSRRFDYTAHGDAINTAARLESANKALGTRICIAKSTAASVEGIVFLPVGTLMLKGKSHGVEVFAPQEGAGATDPWIEAYGAAFAQWSRGEDVGPQALMALHAAHPDHPVLALHARRIRAGESSVRMAA